MRKTFTFLMALFVFTNLYAWNGSGSETDPYQISSSADLIALSNSTLSHTGEFFELTTDIDMAGSTDFIPIGRGTAFKGNFNGNNFKIVNLQLKGNGFYSDNIALFAQIENGMIQNLHIAGISSFEGGKHVAAIAGYARGSVIKNCSSAAVVNGVDQHSQYIGGIVGEGFGSFIIECYNTGMVSATGGDTRNIGGIAGMTSNGSSVKGCYNLGNISGNNWLGGVSGHMGDSDTIRNCYNHGSVSGDGEYIGGVAGIIATGLVSGGIMSSCYNTGKIMGGTYVGGVVGTTSFTTFSCNLGEVTAMGRAVGGIAGSGTVFYSYNTGNITGDEMVGGITGNVNKMNICYNTGTIAAKNIVGGFGGAITGTTACHVYNSYNVGAISADTVDATIGGIMGSVHTGGLVNSNEVKNSYWNKDIFIGKGIGSSSDTIANSSKFQYAYKTTPEMKAEFHDTLGFGWSKDIGNINNGYPVITGFTDSVTIQTKNVYTVTATAGSFGTITPSGDIEATEGSSILYTMTPEEGYTLDKILVDGSERSAFMQDSIYYFNLENISNNHTVSVTFKSLQSGIIEEGKENISCYFANDLLHLSHAAGFQLMIYDINGRMLSQQKLEKDYETIQTDFIQHGVFIVKLQNSHAIQAFKIVK